MRLSCSIFRIKKKSPTEIAGLRTLYLLTLHQFAALAANIDIEAGHMKLKARTPIMIPIPIPIPVFVVAATFKAVMVAVTIPHFDAFLFAYAGLAALSANALRVGGLRKE